MPPSYLFLVSLAEKVGLLVFCANMFFGFFVIYLTLSEIEKAIGAYKHLIILFTSVGIFLSVMNKIVHPNIHFYDKAFIFFTLASPFDLERTDSEILLGKETCDE
uniref:7TM_GPCR_Srx domain-containing protein n=1 Tax=Caenorhabditis tropicalis TaxID=1561998 RepID=A0A1I7T8Z3_9PELO